MKTMKTMLAFVAGALALSACSNEDILNDNVNDNDNSAKLVTLTAYQEGEGTTRAAIGTTTTDGGTTTTTINWTASDAIKVFGTSASAKYTAPNDLTPSTSASFTGEEVAGAAYALYPYQSTATNNAGVITAEVPMTQYAVANSFDPKAALMVGVVNAGSVEFKNVMSYVKVTIPEGMNCKQVTLKAKDAWTTVAGKVNITASTGAWAETDAKEGQAFVRLVPSGSATTLEAGKSYYIAILPQTMSTGFELIFNDNDVIKVKQSASSSVEFKRAYTKKLGAINGFTYTVGTVTAGSITMADRNIGAATTDAYGDYFAWGALRPAYKTKTMQEESTLIDCYWWGGFGTDHVPSSFTDIAAMLWGGNWRMATNDEWNNNKSNSSVQGLPLAGYCQYAELTNAGNEGDYWSSTPNDDCWSDYLYFKDGQSASVDYEQRFFGFSVRPVLAQ